jgi:hypothetical protein
MTQDPGDESGAGRGGTEAHAVGGGVGVAGSPPPEGGVGGEHGGGGGPSEGADYRGLSNYTALMMEGSDMVSRLPWPDLISFISAVSTGKSHFLKS